MRMSSPVYAATLLFAVLLLGANTNAYDTPSKNSAQVKGYYPSYHHAAQRPSQIDWSAYTDVLFFMVIPQEDFTLSYDPKLTKQQGDDLVAEFIKEATKNKVNPHFSTGGWTGSRKFSILTKTDESRLKFARVLVDFGKNNGFFGIELDWEHPNAEGIGCNTKDPADVVNFGKLAQDIRSLWPDVTLTAALSINGFIGADGKPATKTETAFLTQNLDYINLMAYDVYGSWTPTTGPGAPIHGTCAPPGFKQSVETGYQAARNQGFKSSQIILGIPGYAKRLELTSPKLVPKVVNGKTTYYYQNHTTVTPPGGKFDDKPGKDVCGNVQNWGGSFLVNELISNKWLSEDQRYGGSGYLRYFDACSGQPFLTNGKYLISYDDQNSTIAKAQYAKQTQLGGIFFFDTMGPPTATVRAAGQALRN